MIIQPGSKTEQKQTVKNQSEVQAQQTEPKIDDDFASMLKGILSPDSSNQINEEEFFAAIVNERIQTLKGDEAAAKYDAALTKFLEQLRRPDGKVSYEDAAKSALKEMIVTADLSAAEGDKIFTESFKSAQLDGNLDALYDGFGGPNDATIALADMEKSILLAKAMIDKIESGELDAGSMSLDTPSNAKGGAAIAPSATVPLDTTTSTKDSSATEPSDSAGETASAELAGFLYKPVSEKDGKLVILAPQAITGQVESVLLKTLTGEPIEEGEYSAVANGGREHYRFSKPGVEYPKDLFVEIKLKDGTFRRITINDPSAELEK